MNLSRLNVRPHTSHTSASHPHTSALRRWPALLTLAIAVSLCALPASAARGAERSAGMPESTSTIAISSHVGSLIKAMTVILSGNAHRVSWGGANNLIAFSKLESTGYYNVYTMKLDGTHQVCLTCTSSQVPHLNDDNPNWAPSGQYLVFQAQDPNLQFPPTMSDARRRYLSQGGIGVNNNLWIVMADGKKFYQLTHVKSLEGVLHPRFSADGKLLMWSALEHQPGQLPVWVLRVANFSLGSHGPQLTNVRTYQPSTAPHTFVESSGFTHDGTQILFASNMGAPDLSACAACALNIWEMNLASRKLTNLTKPTGEWNELAAVSPSGKHIVWESSHGYAYTPSNSPFTTMRTDLWMMNSDGSHKQQLTFFNKPGDREYQGTQVIVSKNSWNNTGDRVVMYIQVTAADGSTSNKVIIIQFKSRQ